MKEYVDNTCIVIAILFYFFFLLCSPLKPVIVYCCRRRTKKQEKYIQKKIMLLQILNCSIVLEHFPGVVTQISFNNKKKLSSLPLYCLLNGLFFLVKATNK